MEEKKSEKKIPKIKNWFDSANLAIEGILYVSKTQRHMRWHFISAIAILFICLFLGINKLEFIAITVAVVLVLFAEMINTAVEIVVDTFADKYHPLAKIAKDIAAGAVFITAFGAVVIGYLILFPSVSDILTKGISRVKYTPEHITFISLIVVLIAVIITKSYVGRGFPLRGGLPSGHSAVAFSIWVSATLITAKPFISLLIFILSVIVGRSRVTSGVHTTWEVVLGGLIGAITTFLIFQLFR